MKGTRFHDNKRKSTVKPNPIAKALRSSHLQPKVVVDKTKYNRKKKQHD